MNPNVAAAARQPGSRWVCPRRTLAGIAAAAVATAIWLAAHQESYASVDRGLHPSIAGPLFRAGDGPLYPGGPALVREVTLRYVGPTVGSIGLYLGNFSSRATTSAATCVADDPARMLQLEVRQAGQLRYAGTISGFAAAHGLPEHAMQLEPPVASGWPSESAATMVIAVRLDQDAGNAFMGCVTAADLDWIAE